MNKSHQPNPDPSNPRPLKRPASLIQNPARFASRMGKASTHRKDERAANREEASETTRVVRAFGIDALEEPIAVSFHSKVEYLVDCGSLVLRAEYVDAEIGTAYHVGFADRSEPLPWNSLEAAVDALYEFMTTATGPSANPFADDTSEVA